MEPSKTPLSSIIALATGLSLSLATQLRAPGIPVGPGEILLLLWVAAAAGSLLRAKAALVTPATKPWLMFWGVGFLALAVGTINAAVQGKAPPPGTASHDLAAYLFCAGLSLVFVARRGAARLDDRFPYVLALALAVPLVVLWAIAQGSERLFGYELWSSYRFIGWSANPNQTALALLLVPFLFFHYLERVGPSLARLLACLIPGGLAVLAGWSVASSAGRLAWTICLPLLLVTPLVANVRMRREHARALALGGGLVLAILVVGNMVVGLESRSVRPEPKAASADLATQIKGVFINKDIGNQDKIGIRMSLLVNAGKVIVASNGLGYGPGCFSGLDGPFGVSEAHNSLLDWGMSGGVPAMVALLVLLGAIAYRLWRHRHFALLNGLLALVVFAQFHHVLRHPLVWVFLAYAWLEGEPRQQDGPCAV